MDREIIIPRKKSTSIKAALGMLFATLLFAFPILDFYFIDSDIPLFVVILCMLFAPICAWCFFWYLKQIFNQNPILIINEFGIQQRVTSYHVDTIKWEDIQKINIIPYMNNTCFICIILKNPEKYITNERLLNKLNRQRSTKYWGHVRIHSMYFKKELNSVLDIMKYYYAKYNDMENFNQ